MFWHIVCIFAKIMLNNKKYSSMKKLFVIAFAACVAFSFTSCKSSKDSAYNTESLE